MQCYCNSRRVRNLLVMLLTLDKLTQSIVSIHTRLLMPATKYCPFLQCTLHTSRVIDNAREEPVPLPQIFMLKEVHHRQLST